MEYQIWIDFVGIWGSGKSTAINNLKYQINDTSQYKTTDDFYKLNKIRRLIISLVNILRSFNYSFPILLILFRKLLKGIFAKDQILISMIRAFFICYSGRLFLIQNCECKYVFWEGEFHLIPFLEFSLKEKEFVINTLLKLTGHDSMGFVILESHLNRAISMVEKDQFSGKNIRFPNPYQLKYFKKYINKSLRHQQDMIKILEKQIKKIYRIHNANDINLDKIL